ncbi:hypothetical protein [Agrococcus sp. Ld7]|uniref:hypothetical protein n=1 Tax=Agrococcus sp. Ld7 TaxID=649148 RepID=UPI003864281F
MQPIGDDDVERVAAFLHARLNRRVPAGAWTSLLRPPWAHRGPNRGFQLLADGEVVGVYAAVYSVSRTGRSVCNLAAFCVLDGHRGHSLRLLRAIIRQPGFVFTDLSPSGSVPALNARLGFEHLDTATRFAINAPRLARHAVRIAERPEDIRALLEGTDLQVYDDHCGALAARHLVVHTAEGYAYLMYRRVRRKRLGIFAAPIFVGGDPAVLRDAWPQVAARLLRHGLPVTLAEERVLGFTPSGFGRALGRPRPRMFRGNGVDACEIDYLYSELPLLDW